MISGVMAGMRTGTDRAFIREWEREASEESNKGRQQTRQLNPALSWFVRDNEETAVKQGRPCLQK